MSESNDIWRREPSLARELVYRVSLRLQAVQKPCPGTPGGAGSGLTAPFLVERFD